MKHIKYILLSAVVLGFTACNDVEDVLEANGELPENIELPALTAGSADFSKFVSIGNSLTSGFTDNALFIAAQENSFPKMLSEKFALVGGGAFTQPLMNDNFGGLLAGGTPVLNSEGNNRFGPRLYFYSDSNPECPDLTGPKTLGIDPTDSGSVAIGSTTDFVLNNPAGPFNNMGVPGAASFHLIATGYGNIANLAAGSANPYFVRMTGATPNATVLDLALEQSPSFVSLWIGNNDVLGYATSGGDPTLGEITSQGLFDGSVANIISDLEAANVQGVMANIPYVTTIPHFTTVPYNPLDPNDECTTFGAQVPLLNTTFAALNDAFAFLEMPE